MSFIRQNLLSGTTDALLTDSGDTLSSPGLADLAEITSPDVARIVLDPLSDNGTPEIVTVTAHGDSATTATITRAAEDADRFPAREHPISTRWILTDTVQTLIPQGGPLTENLDVDNFILHATLSEDHGVGMGPIGGVGVGFVGVFEGSENAGLMMFPTETGFGWVVIDANDPQSARSGVLPVAQSLSTDAPVIRAFATITQTDYDALDPPDEHTLYVIVEVP